MADEGFELPPEEAEEGAPEWIVTFGDMMSLLMCFFILLLSFSQMDKAKFKEIAGSLERAFGVQRQIPVYNIPMGMKMIARDFDQAFVEQALIGQHDSEFQASLRELEVLRDQSLLEINIEDEQITLRILGQTTFDSGSTVIKTEMTTTLLAIGKVLSKSDRDIVVAGHTDNVPISGGIHKSNLELSAARAAAVVEFFLSHGFVTPNHIATMGFGEYRPLEANDTPEHREQNRRVDIILARRINS
jgi:chemotaxis protein MotB